MRTWKAKMHRLRVRMMPRLLPTLVLTLLLAFLLAPASWAADSEGSSQKSEGGHNIVTFGNDVHVKAGESVDTVVTFGGDVKVDGTVRTGVYTFGGDLVVGPLGQLGSGVTDHDLTIATFNGSTTAIPGAEVTGREIEVEDMDWLSGDDLHVVTPFNGGLTAWGAGLAATLLLGLLAAALLPRQLKAVKSQLEERPGRSFGLGVLTALVIVPLVSLVLLISIVGILALIPWALIVIPAVCLLGYLAAAMFVGERLLRATETTRAELWLMILVGVVVLQLVTLVPVVGALAFGLINLAGLGAALLALLEWRRTRKKTVTTNPETAATTAPLTTVL